MALLHPTKAELGTVACSSLPLKLQLTDLTWITQLLYWQKQ